jgi:hypothetical protein
MVELARGMYRIEVELLDKNQDVTDVYDKATGISWESSNEELGSVVDTDVNPKDAEVELKRIMTEADPDLMFSCRLDGDPSAGVRDLQFQSDPIRVMPGAVATGVITMHEVVEPEPTPT